MARAILAGREDSMERDAIREFVDWVEATDVPETPLLRTGPPWGHDIPAYYWPTIRVKVEPFHALHERLAEVLADISHDDDEFWSPSPEYLSLEALRHDLYRLALETVPNPDYNAEQAAAYREEHPEKFRIEWVQSYVGTPDAEPS
jgi:hypothetical protein